MCKKAHPRLERSSLLDSTMRRRRFLSMSAACGLMTAAAVPQFAVAARELDEPPANPAEALRRLYEGNQRFAAGRSLASHRDLERVKMVAIRQTPYAAFLGCADSRVPIEIVFDQGFGDLFVTRIAGNVASSENIGSLEFGTHVLGAKVLYVLGHSNCGAVTAAMRGDEVPGQISALFQYIRPSIKAAKGDLDAAIRENVRNQAMILAESSPVIARRVRAGQLIVAGGIYDLKKGLVTPVEIPAA